MSESPFQSALGWQSLTSQQRQREYSPSSCLGGNIEPFLTEYAQASEIARQWCASEGLPLQTRAYGPSPSQSIDVVTPGSDGAPVVLFIHGGYWQALSKRESFSPAADFLSRGVAYAAIDYTLAPSATIDQIVAECRSGLATLRASASALNIDANRIFVAGSSAGAHLAAMLSLNPASAWRPAGIVLLSGIYELEPLIGTTINDALKLDTAAAHRNSPARFSIERPPPSVIAWGDNETDQFKRQSRLFARALGAKGPKPTEVEVVGRNHFDILSDLGRDTSTLGNAVARLIESTRESHAQL